MISLQGGTITFETDDGKFSFPVYMSHPSATPFVVAVAEAVAAVVVQGTPPEVVGASSGKASFSKQTAKITYNGETYTPDNYTDIAEADVKAFAEAIYTNGGERLYAAKQALEEAKNG